MGTRHWTVGTIVVIVVARFPQPLPSVARSVLHPFSPRSLEVMATPRLGLRWLNLSRKAGVARLLPPEALTSLGQALVQRVTFAAPCALTPCRRVCARCHGDLTLSSPDKTRDAHATCWIYAEPEARQVTHRPGWCARCFDVATVQTGIGQTKEVRRRTRFWCGFMEEPVPGNARAYEKRLDHEFLTVISGCSLKASAFLLCGCGSGGTASWFTVHPSWERLPSSACSTAQACLSGRG